MRKSVQEPKRTEIPQDGKLGLPLFSCGAILIEPPARSYKPTTSRERGWDLFHRQSRDVGPLPRHSRHGEGEALPLRGVRKTVQEPERPQVSQVPLTALQPRAQTGRRHESSHQHAGTECQYRRSRPHRFGRRDGPITAVPRITRRLRHAFHSLSKLHEPWNTSLSKVLSSFHLISNCNMYQREGTGRGIISCREERRHFRTVFSNYPGSLACDTGVPVLFLSPHASRDIPLRANNSRSFFVNLPRCPLFALVDSDSQGKPSECGSAWALAVLFSFYPIHSIYKLATMRETLIASVTVLYWRPSLVRVVSIALGLS